MNKTRIKCVDDLGNVSYIHQNTQGIWRCTLSNGIPASFFYAGVGGDEMSLRFALEDRQEPDEILALVKSLGSPRYTYSIF